MPGPRPLIKMRACLGKHCPAKKVGRPAEIVIQVGKYVVTVIVLLPSVIHQEL